MEQNLHLQAVISTMGLDLGDRWSRYCILDQDGVVVEEDRVRTSVTGLEQRFQQKPCEW